MIDTGKISVSYKFPFFFPGKSTFAQVIIGHQVKIGFQICAFLEKLNKQKQKDRHLAERFHLPYSQPQ